MVTFVDDALLSGAWPSNPIRMMCAKLRRSISSMTCWHKVRKSWPLIRKRYQISANIFKGDVTYTADMYDVLDGADALAIVTEWNEFRTPDFQQIKSRMKSPVMFDGRNIYDLEDIPADFFYSSIGREIIYPK